MDHPIFPLPETDTAKTRFAGRYLSRPVFLEAQELRGLERDLSLLRSALSTLPQRLYDGELMAFGRAVGMTEFQAACVKRSEGPSPRALTHMAGADIYKDATGFRLLESNLGSPVGGFECVDICEALLAIPEMADFLAKEGLVYPDTTEAMLATLRSETGYPAGTDPAVALVGMSGSFPAMEAVMSHHAARWADRGLRTTIGHLGELARSHGRLRLRGEPIDVLYRLFTIDDVLTHASDGLLEPVLSAAECGEVVIFTPLSAELYGSKAALAMLSEPGGQIGLTPEEQGACGRLLPWTRRLHAGETSLEDGSRVNLVEYVLEHQDDLVLKPSLSYGGNGVAVGASPDITPAMWRDRVAQAVNSSYIVQRLVRPEPELFPTETPGRPTAWTVAWRVFTMQQGYAGTLVRAVPDGTWEKIVNLAKGSVPRVRFPCSDVNRLARPLSASRVSPASVIAEARQRGTGSANADHRKPGRDPSNAQVRWPAAATKLRAAVDG